MAVSCGLNELGHTCIQYLRVCFLISGLRRYVLSAPSCGADLEDHQRVFGTLWRVHGSCSLAILAELRTPVSHEIALSVATSAWLHDVPELVPPAEARQLRWCDVETVVGPPSTRDEKVYGIVIIRTKKAQNGQGAQLRDNLSAGQYNETFNT